MMLGIGLAMTQQRRSGPPAPFIVAPTITAPADAATDIGETPTITTSAFAVTNGSDSHASSDFEVASDTGFVTVVASTYDDATNKVSWTVPAATLSVSTTYYIRARHTGTAEGDSAWSSTVSFTTAATFVDAVATAIIDEITTPPDTARAAAINALVIALKGYGVWTKLDRLYVTAAADSQAAGLDWKHPATSGNALTAVNSPAFTADSDYTCDGSTSYLNTNFKPSTGAAVMTTSSHSYLMYCPGFPSASNMTQFGHNGSSIVQLRRNTSGNWDGRIGGNNIASASVAAGLAGVTNNGTTTTLYVAGASVGTASDATPALATEKILLGARADAVGAPERYSDGPFSLMLMGGYLTGTEVANIETAFDAYLAAL